MRPKCCRSTQMLLAVAVCALMAVSCQLNSTPSNPAPPTAPSTQPFVALDLPHLPNVHRVSAKVISGGAPEGEEGFKELSGLGVKTIISVDGMTPDAEMAHKYGMKYVHLPFGYDSVPRNQAMAIAKALEEMPGPIYVHCHHGKHRSAAAVATACVMNGMLSPDQAESVLETFGTGTNYTGLWASAREAEPVSQQALRRLNVMFVEKAPIPPLAEAMVHVDEYNEHLKAIQRSGWRTPADHPDLDPPHEAIQLQELFTEIARTDAVKNHPADFATKLENARKNAESLQQVLAASPVDGSAADAALKQVAGTCTACHAAYRD